MWIVLKQQCVVLETCVWWPCSNVLKINFVVKNKFKRVIIAKNNQEVLNKSNWVFIGVLPKVANQILPNLNFRKNMA